MVDEAMIKEIHDHLVQRREDRAPAKLARMQRRDRRLTYAQPKVWQAAMIIAAVSGIGAALGV